MRIKRFVAPEMRDAIRAVREDLGPDAVILSNRDIDGGVEIVAAHDLEDSLAVEGDGADLANNQSESSKYSRAAARDIANQPADVDAPDSAQESATFAAAPSSAHPPPAREVRRLEEEIRHLRGLIEDQLCGLAWGDFGRRHPLRASMFRRLIALGLSHNLSAELAKSAIKSSEPREAWREIVDELSRRLLVGQRDLLSHGGLIAFVGPTGVGKTTSIAKVAARFSMRFGSESVALITTDSYRVGAQEQLRTFANIMNVPLRTCHDEGELGTAVKDFAARKLVLIDTAGLGQRDERLQAQLEMVGHGGNRLRRYLVLSAAVQGSVLDETVQAYGEYGIDACLLTKLDEASRLGGALSVAIENQLPIAYVSNGQRVPEDLSRPRPEQLISQAITMARRSQPPSETEIEIAFGQQVANAR